MSHYNPVFTHRGPSKSGVREDSVLALLLETNWLVLCSGRTAAHSLSSQHNIENEGKKGMKL